MGRFLFMFGVAVLRTFMAWAIVSIAGYTAWRIYNFTPDLRVLSDPSFWTPLRNWDGWVSMAAIAWADRTFIVMGLIVAGLQLLWASLTIAMILRFQEIEDEQKLTELAALQKAGADGYSQADFCR